MPPQVWVGTAALLLSSVSTMALPYFIGRLIDQVQTNGAADPRHARCVPAPASHLCVCVCVCILM